MTFIRCNHCKWLSPHIIGTKGEHNFIRSIDTLQSEETYEELAVRKACQKKRGDVLPKQTKNFYCTNKCYLEHVFLTHVSKVVHVNYSDISLDKRHHIYRVYNHETKQHEYNEELTNTIDFLREEKFDEITVGKKHVIPRAEKEKRDIDWGRNLII